MKPQVKETRPTGVGIANALEFLQHHRLAVESRRRIELSVSVGTVTFFALATYWIADSRALAQYPGYTLACVGALIAAWLTACGLMLWRIEVASGTNRQRDFWLAQGIEADLGKSLGKLEPDEPRPLPSQFLRQWAAWPPFFICCVIGIGCWLLLLMACPVALTRAGGDPTMVQPIALPMSEAGLLDYVGKWCVPVQTVLLTLGLWYTARQLRRARIDREHANVAAISERVMTHNELILKDGMRQKVVAACEGLRVPPNKEEDYWATRSVHLGHVNLLWQVWILGGRPRPGKLLSSPELAGWEVFAANIVVKSLADASAKVDANPSGASAADFAAADIWKGINTYEVTGGQFNAWLRKCQDTVSSRKRGNS